MLLRWIINIVLSALKCLYTQYLKMVHCVQVQLSKLDEPCTLLCGIPSVQHIIQRKLTGFYLGGDNRQGGFPPDLQLH